MVSFDVGSLGISLHHNSKAGFRHVSRSSKAPRDMMAPNCRTRMKYNNLVRKSPRSCCLGRMFESACSSPSDSSPGRGSSSAYSLPIAISEKGVDVTISEIRSEKKDQYRL